MDKRVEEHLEKVGIRSTAGGGQGKGGWEELQHSLA